MNNLQRPPRFERNVYLVSDIIGALSAVDQTATNILSHLDSPEARAYASGHRDALLAVAEAFRIADEVKVRMR